MFALTFAITGTLSWVHTSTERLVAGHERERYQRAVVKALGIDAESPEAVFAAYEKLVRHEREGGVFYVGRVAGRHRYAARFSGPGVWGDIVGVVSLSADGTRIVALSILEQNETPGLGGRITEEEFLDQFRGEHVPRDGIIFEQGQGDLDDTDGAVDAITGATGTSRAFSRIVNRAIDDVRAFAASGS